jgi:hypothetical protein
MRDFFVRDSILDIHAPGKRAQPRAGNHADLGLTTDSFSDVLCGLLDGFFQWGPPYLSPTRNKEMPGSGFRHPFRSRSYAWNRLEKSMKSREMA